jgi:hypothetical protein
MWNSWQVANACQFGALESRIPSSKFRIPNCSLPVTSPACAFEFVPLLRRRFHRLHARGALPDGQAPPVHHELERDVVAFAVTQDRVDGVLTFSQAPEPFTHLTYPTYPTYLTYLTYLTYPTYLPSPTHPTHPTSTGAPGSTSRRDRRT